MALLTTYTIDFNGVNVASSYAAAAASQEFVNDGRTFIHIKNTSGGVITCTITTAGTVQSHAIADTVVSVAATTGEQMAGPFAKSLYNAADGNIDITWSATASVTIGVFNLP